MYISDLWFLDLSQLKSLLSFLFVHWSYFTFNFIKGFCCQKNRIICFATTQSRPLTARQTTYITTPSHPYSHHHFLITITNISSTLQSASLTSLFFFCWPGRLSKSKRLGQSGGPPLQVLDLWEYYFLGGLPISLIQKWGTVCNVQQDVSPIGLLKHLPFVIELSDHKIGKFKMRVLKFLCNNLIFYHRIIWWAVLNQSLGIILVVVWSPISCL